MKTNLVDDPPYSANDQMVLLPPEVLGPVLGMLAAVSLSIGALAIRRGTSTHEGSSFDALFIVLVVNIVLLTPSAAILYYPEYNLTLRSIGAFAAAGLIGTGLARMGYYKTIELLGASRAEPVKASMPLFATLFAVFFLGEVVSGLRWFGITVIIFGIAVISFDLSGGQGLEEFKRVSLPGFLLGIGAAVLFGLEPTFAKIGLAEGTPSLVGLVVKTVAAAGFFFTYGAARNQIRIGRLRRGDGFLWYVVAGVANTMFLVAYYAGLTIAPVSVVAPIMQTTPLFVAILSYFFLPDLERITKYVVVGTILVVTGTTVITFVT